MADLSRKYLQEEIIVGSEKVWFHPMIAYHRGISNPAILKNSEFISYINVLVPKFIACKHCHLLFDYGSWSRRKFLMHLESIHHIGTSENVNFIFPIVPRRKKEITIAETISTSEPSPKPEVVPILETPVITAEEIPHPETPLNNLETAKQVPDLNSKIPKKRGRKSKQGCLEKGEKKIKNPKAKKAKQDPPLS